MKQNTVYFVFAGTAVQIVFQQPTVELFLHDRLVSDIRTFFAPYLTTDRPPHVSSTLTIVERKRPKSHAEYLIKKRLQIDLFDEKSKTSFETYYDVGILQFHSVLFHMLFKELLHDGNVFTLHGSAVQAHGGAVLFVGNTGSGKSTIINLLKPMFTPIADDQLFIRLNHGIFEVYQLPFFEKTFAIKKVSLPFPFTKLFFLHKSNTVSVRPVDESKTYQLLRNHITFNADTLAMWTFLAQHRSFAHLYFSTGKDRLGDLQSVINSTAR